MNRMRVASVNGNTELRVVSLEQLARHGRARWMVDDGTWARIEGELMKSFDRMQDASRDCEAMPSSVAFTEEVVDYLANVLSRLGVQS
jgi:hypothetical protein